MPRETTGQALEPGTGNPYIIPEEKPELPPVDLNIYCYKYDPAVPGSARFKGVIIGPRWEDQPFDYTKLSCYRPKEGEESMGKKREAPSKEILQELLIKHNSKIEPIRKELKVSWGDAKRWLIEAGLINEFGVPILQAPNPDPVQVASQEPDKGEREPATTIIPEPVKMPIGCELPLSAIDKAMNWGKEFEKLAHIGHIRPEDIDMSKQPPEPWLEQNIIKEQVETWLTDVYRLGVSKERKLQMIGKLLEIEVA